MRKQAFCICENKDTDQLRGNREADQHLCFRYTDTTIPLFSKSEISSFEPSSVTAQPGLCPTRSETPKTGFLTTRLKPLKLYLGTEAAGRLHPRRQFSRDKAHDVMEKDKNLTFTDSAKYHSVMLDRQCHEKTCFLHMRKERH